MMYVVKWREDGKEYSQIFTFKDKAQKFYDWLLTCEWSSGEKIRKISK